MNIYLFRSFLENGKISKVIISKTWTDERDKEENLMPNSDRLAKVGRFIYFTSINE